MAMRKGTRAATESLGFLVVVAGVIVFVNILGLLVWGRVDCTENELFSLSDGSKRVAKNLTDTMTITAYFTPDLPYPFNNTERQVRDLLTEYEAVSGGNIDVRFVSVDSDEEREEAEAAGVRRVQHQAIEDDNVSVKEGYRGLVMTYLDKKEVIPVIEDTSGLEYRITLELKEMVGDKKKVAIVSGHEGPTLEQGLSRLAQCAPTYEISMVSAGDEISADEYAAVLLVEPHTELSQAELERLNQFVMNGGNLGIFGGSMKLEIEQMPQAVPVDTGVNRLLRPWGVVVENGLVADAQSGRAPLRTNIGVLPVPHPPVPIVRFDEAQSEHPVLFRLSEAPFPFVSPLALVGDEIADVEKTTLARSSDLSWLLTGDSIGLQPRLPREWQQTGEEGPFPLMVALRGKLPNAFTGGSNMSGAEEPTVEAPAKAEDARVLVAGTGFFMRDEIMGQPQEGQECELSGPLALALNAIDWLAQDADLVAIRAKNVEEPTIEVPQNVRQAEDAARSSQEEALTAAQQGDEQAANEAVEERDDALKRRKEALAEWDTKKALYRWGNMLGIPIIFALFGLIRWQLRQNKRKQLKI